MTVDQLVQEAKDLLKSVGSLSERENDSAYEILQVVASTYDGGFSAFVAYVCEDGDEIDAVYDELMERFGGHLTDNLYEGVYDGKEV